jgi:hypothetical protein
MLKNYKRLCTAIAGQLVDDFLKKPDLRFEIEKDLRNDSLVYILDAVNIHPDQLEKALNISAINESHRIFLKAVKKLEDERESMGIIITIEELAIELGWTEEQVERHCKEYGFMYLFPK